MEITIGNAYVGIPNGIAHFGQCPPSGKTACNSRRVRILVMSANGARMRVSQERDGVTQPACRSHQLPQPGAVCHMNGNTSPMLGSVSQDCQSVGRLLLEEKDLFGQVQVGLIEQVRRQSQRNLQRIGPWALWLDGIK
jgi:hypothetical protein